MKIIPNTKYNLPLWKKYAQGLWEPDTIKFIKYFSNINGEIIDIGAHIDLFSLTASFYFKKVYSFEPSKLSYLRLVQNVQNNKRNNVKLFNCGIYTFNGNLDMYSTGSGSSGTSVYKTKDTRSNNFTVLKKKFVESVKVISVKDLSKLLDLANIKIIKIDIEGSEYKILPTMREIFCNKTILHLSMHSRSLLKESFLSSVNYKFENTLDVISILDEYYEIYYYNKFLKLKKISMTSYLKLSMKFFLHPETSFKIDPIILIPRNYKW